MKATISSASRLTMALVSVCAAPVLAQEAVGIAATEVVDESEIVVTGSLLGRSDQSASQPVWILSSEDLRSTGQVSLLEALRDVPATGTGSFGQSFNIGGAGIETINLRNAGNRRTLVLINGRRIPIFSDINGFSGQDISTIPSNALGRIEVLRDGAATTYGADAVAGVVNFIMRDADGLELNAYQGLSSRGDAPASRVGAIFGKRFERGSLTVTATYQKQNDLMQDQRLWARNPIVSLAGTGLAGSGSTPGGTVSAIGGGVVACYPIAGGANIAPNCQRYDPSVESSLIAESELRSFSGHGYYDLTDGIRVKATAILSHREGFQSISGAQLATSSSTGPFTRLVVPATNSNNPYGRDVTIAWRLSDYGARPTRSNVDMTFLTGGFEGKIFDRFRWDVTQSFARNQISTSTDNGVDALSLNRLLNPQLCSADTACAAVGAISNLDDLLSKRRMLTQGQRDYLFYDQTARLRFTSMQTVASVSGTLFDLPGGAVVAAIGYEHRKEQGSVIPDALTQSGNAATNNIRPTKGSFNTDEVLGEITVPILKDQPFFEALELNGQVRYSSFSNFGGATVYKIGANWTPLNGVRLRGSYGTSFRAPDVIEVYGGGVADNGSFTDPCNNDQFRSSNATVTSNCTALGVPGNFRQVANTLPELTGGNPALRPERGKSLNVGLVLTPIAIPDFSATVDYYDLRVTDAIGSAVQANLNACYLDPNLIARAASVSDICFTFASRNPDGSLQRILARQSNIGRFKASGVDFSVGYALRDIAGGTVSAKVNGTYLLTTDFGRGNIAGTYGGDLTSLIGAEAYPRWRGNGQLSYDNNDFGLLARVNYVSSMRDSAVGVSIPVTNSRNYTGTPDYASVDFLVRLRVAGKTEMSIGMNNAFDKDPPYAFNLLKNTLISTYDVLGRYLFVAVSTKF